MDSALAAPKKIYYGWYIVGVSFLCWFVADAFGWYTFGLFMGPMGKELGWTVTALTFGLTLRTLVAGALGPFIGPLVDTRHGARILMVLGVLAAGAVPLLVSQVHSLTTYYIYFGVIGALGMVGFGGLVTNALISKWFVRFRGRAIGISAMGVSISGLVFVPVVHTFISRYGWRTTLVFLSVIIWALALLPVIFLIRRRPEDMGLRPDGDVFQQEDIAGEADVPEAKNDLEEIWTLKEALRTKAMWLLLVGFNITGMALMGVFLHFYPYLEAKGFSGNVAALAMTILAFCAAMVKIPWGLVAERVNLRYCMAACYGGCALSLIVLIMSSSNLVAYLAAIVYGITIGGDMVIREVVWANYYGRHFLGTIRGVTMPLNLISMAGGPLFAAWLKDTTGNYDVGFKIFFFVALFGTLFLYMAKRPMKKIP